MPETIQEHLRSWFAANPSETERMKLIFATAMTPIEPAEPTPAPMDDGVLLPGGGGSEFPEKAMAASASYDCTPRHLRENCPLNGCQYCL